MFNQNLSTVKDSQKIKGQLYLDKPGIYVCRLMQDDLEHHFSAYSQAQTKVNKKNLVKDIPFTYHLHVKFSFDQSYKRGFSLPAKHCSFALSLVSDMYLFI